MKDKASPCLFYSARRRLKAAVHGDDITVKGSREQVEKFMEEFAKVYETKTQIMGGDAGLPNSVKILNRTLTWTKEDGGRPKACGGGDQRPGRGVGKGGGHAVRRFARGREGRGKGRRPSFREGGGHHVPGGGSKAELLQLRPTRHPVRHDAGMRIDEPADRRELDVAQEDREVLQGQATSRSVIQVAEAADHFQSVHGLGLGRRQGDQALHVRRVHLPRRARHRHGPNKGQHVVALSSAEAELYAGTRAATECIGVQSLMRDLGGERAVRMSMDSSAALVLHLRKGLGKARHICIQEL